MKPDNGTTILENFEFLLVSEGCQGQVLFANDIKVTVIEMDEQLITQGIQLAVKHIRANQSQISVNVIKAPAFEKNVHKGIPNQTVNIKVDNFLPQYQILTELSFSISGDIISVISPVSGSFKLEIITNGTLPMLKIAADIIIEGKCQIDFDVSGEYYVGAEYEIKSLSC